ncbi:class I SAM-dependent methyltransferase [Dactylosporangium sp. CA-139066]|uniref:class I SAM-dependent methyltransferase n=1 Tax=Dactylosporangium sp. CA-139066 TaxID=3239930 RepID=UPI003D92CEF2
MPHDHHHHEHHHDGLADMLDLDAVVLHEFHAGIVAWVREHVPAPGTVVDIGAGTGAGTFELLAQYPQATVVAVDSSEEMLRRLKHKAHSDRVRTVLADLDAGWPGELPAPDLVWATNSMHHMADPVRVLRGIRDALAPGGALALLEIEGFPRFLGPGDELEERIHAAIARRRAVDMPHLGGDWGAALRSAGFEIRAERRFTADLSEPPLEATRRYAQASFERVRENADLTPEDVKAVDALLEALPRRDDLTVHAERLGWIAVREA